MSEIRIGGKNFPVDVLTLGEWIAIKKLTDGWASQPDRAVEAVSELLKVFLGPLQRATPSVTAEMVAEMRPDELIPALAVLGTITASAMTPSPPKPTVN